jgi:hypothetical protein
MRVHLSNFDAPAVRGKLDMVLLFAGAAREHLALLYERLPNHYTVFLRVVADAVTKAVKKQGTPATFEQVWISIQGDQDFQQLAKQDAAAPVIAAFETSLRANAQVADYARLYLDRANERAVEWIGELRADLAQYESAAILQQVSTKLLVVEFDHTATRPCAGGSRSGPIGWVLQPESFAFYGAILAELMFVHEYLCHVLPANRDLEKDVREVWLNDSIIYGVRNLPDPDREREPAKYVWQRFLHLYQKHFASDPYGLDSSLGMDQLTIALSRRPLFWKITLAILSAPNGKDASNTISQLFNALSEQTDKQLAVLGTVQWTTLEEFLEAINIIKSIT